jgi:hypothetical protein
VPYLAVSGASGALQEKPGTHHEPIRVDLRWIFGVPRSASSIEVVVARRREDPMWCLRRHRPRSIFCQERPASLRSEYSNGGDGDES